MEAKNDWSECQVGGSTLYSLATALTDIYVRSRNDSFHNGTMSGFHLISI